MPNRPWQETPIVQYPQMGGLDTTSAPSQVIPNRLRTADNCIFGIRKTLQKRGGLVPQNTTAMTGAATIKLLTDFWEAGSSGAPTQDLFAVQATHFFKDDGDNTWDDVSGTVTMARDSAVTSCVVGDKLVICSSGTVPMVYAQGSDVESLTSFSGTAAPDSAICEQHLGRLWLVRKTNPHFLFHSGIGALGQSDPSLLSAADGGAQFGVEPDDGDPEGITALFQFRDTLYACKQTKIYRIEGRKPANFRPVLVVDGIGCVAHNMIVPVGGDVLFPSLEGIHSLAVVLNGNLQPEAYISRNIHTTYHEGVNQSRIAHGWGVYNKEIRSVVWTMPYRGKSVNGIALVYNIDTREWTRFSEFKGDSLMLKYNNTTKQQEMWTGGNQGVVYKYTPGKFEDYVGGAIKMKLKSGHIYPDKRFLHDWGYKYFGLLLQPSGNHTVNFSYRIDDRKNSSSVSFSTSSTATQATSGENLPLGEMVLGQNRLGEDRFVSPLTFPMEGSGRSFEWKIENTELDEGLEMSGWYVELDPESTRRGR